MAWQAIIHFHWWRLLIVRHFVRMKVNSEFSLKCNFWCKYSLKFTIWLVSFRFMVPGNILNANIDHSLLLILSKVRGESLIAFLSISRSEVQSFASIPPEALMHFPLFQIFPIFPKKIQTPWWNFPINFTFSQKNCSIFIRQNFWWPSFGNRLQILNSPYFLCFSTFPLFPENYYSLSLLFSNSLRWFRKIYVFFTCFMCFSSSLVWPWCIYASHNLRIEIILTLT